MDFLIGFLNILFLYLDHNDNYWFFSNCAIQLSLILSPSLQALPSKVSYSCFATFTSLLLSSLSLSSSTGRLGRGALQYVKELNWSGAMNPEGSVLNGGNIWSTKSLSLMYLTKKQMLKFNTTIVADLKDLRIDQCLSGKLGEGARDALKTLL